MNNQLNVKKDEYYNQMVKEEYLNTLTPSLQHVCSNIFTQSKNIEAVFKKDLYEFSLDELEQVVKNLNPATTISARNYRSKLLLYIDWAIEHGRRLNNINPLYGVTGEWDKKLVDVVGDRYFSIETIDEIVDALDNPQDKALVYCLFEGVVGKGTHEILQMRIYDLHKDVYPYTLDIRDEQGEVKRQIEVSDRCAQFITEAYNQHTYVSISNGSRQSLIECDGRVFKKTVWRNSEHVRRACERHNLVIRLAHIKDKFGLGEFSTITISVSGRIKMAADYIEQNGRMDSAGYALIGRHHNLKQVKWNGHYYYNHSQMRAYINDKYLMSLYGLSKSE